MTAPVQVSILPARERKKRRIPFLVAGATLIGLSVVAVKVL